MNFERKLPVPSTCPPTLAQLMEACWEFEPHRRPTFRSILEALEEIREAAWLQEDQSFYSMQAEWRKEIEELFQEIKEKESVIKYFFRIKTNLYILLTHIKRNLIKYLRNSVAEKKSYRARLQCKKLETLNLGPGNKIYDGKIN